MIEEWHTSSSSSSTISVVDSSSPASRGTHWTCSNNLPTSQGMTITVLAYCTTAEASNELRMKETSSPESLRSWEGDRSNMDLEERGDFHSYEDGIEALGDWLGGAGRKDQAEEGSLYKSLKEAGVFMV